MGLTVKAIKEQLRLAALGVQSAVSEAQTATGIKDKTALFWEPQLINRARAAQKERIRDKDTRDPRLNNRQLVKEARKAVEEQIKVQIQTEVLQWLYMQPEDRYNALPLDSRMSIAFFSLNYLTGIRAALRHQIRPGCHYSGLLDLNGMERSLSPASGTQLDF